ARRKASVYMTIANPCRLRFSARDLYSSSLIQGGRPKRGRPGGRSRGPPPSPLFGAGGSGPGGLNGPATAFDAAVGAFGAATSFVRSSPRGRGRSPSRGPPAGSRLGRTIVGRFVSPSRATLAPKSTRLTRVTLL